MLAATTESPQLGITVHRREDPTARRARNGLIATAPALGRSGLSCVGRPMAETMSNNVASCAMPNGDDRDRGARCHLREQIVGSSQTSCRTAVSNEWKLYESSLTWPSVSCLIGAAPRGPSAFGFDRAGTCSLDRKTAGSGRAVVTDALTERRLTFAITTRSTFRADPAFNP